MMTKVGFEATVWVDETESAEGGHVCSPFSIRMVKVRLGCNRKASFWRERIFSCINLLAVLLGKSAIIYDWI